MSDLAISFVIATVMCHQACSDSCRNMTPLPGLEPSTVRVRSKSAHFSDLEFLDFPLSHRLERTDYFEGFAME